MDYAQLLDSCLDCYDMSVYSIWIYYVYVEVYINFNVEVNEKFYIFC